jgi:hypothetical protein
MTALLVSFVGIETRLDKILSTNETIANDNKMVAFDAWVREKYKNRPRPERQGTSTGSGTPPDGT